MLHDDRESSSISKRSQRILQLDREVTGVQYHPQIDNLFITCDFHGEVHLRDVRMAFGPARTRTQEGIVLSVQSPFPSAPRSDR